MSKRPQHRFLFGFLAGTAVAAATLLVVPSGGSFASARYEDLSLFSSVLRIVRDNYVDEVDETVLIRGAVRGMLAELDPHSSYLDPEAHQEMQIDTRGEFHGLGIEISKRRDGYIEVVSPIDGTPAWQAGIRAQDQIVAICPTVVPEDWTEPCRGTKGMDLHEAVSLMRGKKGTTITIRIFREGFERPEPFTIRRDVVKVASVEGRLVEPGYAYLRVRSFQERTAEDLAETQEALLEENGGPFDGVVLDLRDNPGGLLDQAVKVADLFLAEGLIVYTQGRVESQRQEFRAREQGEQDPPMAVLVNAGSASASEIVAGALQDQDRALVLGTRSDVRQGLRADHHTPSSDRLGPAAHDGALLHARRGARSRRSASSPTSWSPNASRSPWWKTRHAGSARRTSKATSRTAMPSRRTSRRRRPGSPRTSNSFAPSKC